MKTATPPYQMWGGRFALGPAEALDALNRSLPVDHRLWPQDVAASKALIGYSLGLGQPGVLGHLFTSWSKPDELAEWPPLVANAPLVTAPRAASPGGSGRPSSR